VFPFALLGSMVAGFGVLVAIATDDPGFSLEKDYYKKAVSWDSDRAVEARSDALGWQLAVQSQPHPTDRELVVRLRDRAGQPLSGARVELEAFPVARGNQIVSGSFQESSVTRGEYRAQLSMQRSGLWELRFRAARGSDTFVHTTRLELFAEAQ
jgi:hypothetical protein